MAPNQSRRSSPVLPSLVVGAGLCLLRSHLPTSFLAATPAAHGRQGRTAMRGFKEDFESWRSSLTPEEREMVQTQAAGEFNKKFRKSDEFKKDLPEEKVKSFSKILSKFFEAEAEDYKKEAAAKVPNYNRLLEKAGDKVLDFAMSNRIVAVDRNADRRYHFATQKIMEAKEKGEKFPPSSPMEEVWFVENDTPEKHQALKETYETLQKLKDKLPAEQKAAMEKVLAEGVPAMGEEIKVVQPMVLMNQLSYAGNLFMEGLKEYSENATEAEVKEVKEKAIPEAYGKVIGDLTEKYNRARNEVETEVDNMKKFFRSRSEDKYKTKADVLRSIWEELPKHMGKPLPPVDEEIVAELEKQPVVKAPAFTTMWGTADTLYKSEAIDAFGVKYLLGIYETQEEARAAFEEWNSEYEKSRKDMKVEMQQWSKQENARLEADTSGRDRIQKILEEARR